MADLMRRNFVTLGVYSSALLASGCGGGSEAAAPMLSTASSDASPGTSPPGSSPSPSSSREPEWTPYIPPLINNSTFDLSTTLPFGVAKGGTYAVSSAGKPLPAGIALTAAGSLSISGSAAFGTTDGVIFAYAI